MFFLGGVITIVIHVASKRETPRMVTVVSDYIGHACKYVEDLVTPVYNSILSTLKQLARGAFYTFLRGSILIIFLANLIWSVLYLFG